MATKYLDKFRWAVILGGIFLSLSAIAAYAAWYAYGAVDAGAVYHRGRDIERAAQPVIFWIAVGWPAAIGLTCAVLAVRLLVIIANMHRKGQLLVADKD